MPPALHPVSNPPALYLAWRGVACNALELPAAPLQPLKTQNLLRTSFQKEILTVNVHFLIRTNPMPLLGCIADDFTGGTDLASNLVKSGFRTVQTIGIPQSATKLEEIRSEEHTS